MAKAQVEFSKWHGLGNDYIILAAAGLPFELTSARVVAVCDRHYGIGSDGILFWSGNEEEGFYLQIHNPDGSRGEVSGNGLRMFGKYLYRKGFSKNAAMTVNTDAGIVKPAVLSDGQVRVSMGRACLGGKNIVGYEGAAGRNEAVGVHLEAAGEEFEFTFVDVGNPHCVIEADDLESIELERLGPVLERHDLFPNRVNVEFMKVTGPAEVSMRVWERGVGETSACGSGACAVAVTARRLRGMASPVTVHLAGGDLQIEVEDEMEIYMTGPAEEVFTGVMSEEFINRIKEL